MLLVLPPLRDEHGVRDATPGRWAGAGVSVLETLAQGLDRGTVGTSSGEAVSIPDIWAQPEVFRVGLLNEHSLLHARCQAEWRGLLALFALGSNRHPYGYRLTTRTVELNGAGSFLAMLRRLPPVESLNNPVRPGELSAVTTPWTKVGVITLDEQPIGLLIPTTLVCPAKTAHAGVRSVSWLRNGRLTDPTGPDSELSADDLRSLIKFCEELRRSVTAANEPLLGALAHQLDGFREAASARLRAKRETYDGGQFNVRPDLLSVDLPDTIYEGLRRAWPIQRQEDHHHTVIRLRSDISSDRKGLVLADPRLVDGGRPAHEIIIWDGISLAQMATEVTRDRAVRALTEAGYIYVTPDNFFSDRICEVGGSEVLTHLEHKKFLLPVTPLALLVMTAEQIERALHIEAQGDGGYLVNLAVDMHASGAAGPTTHVIRKMFSHDDVVELEVPPVLSRWPDFQSPDWKAYFVFSAGNPNTSMFIRSLISLPGLSRTLSTEAHTAGQGKLGLQLQKGEEPFPESRLSWAASGGSQAAIYQCTFPPEAAFCVSLKKKDTRADQIPSAGILRMPKGADVPQPAHGVRCRIGVDFGTTKTMVYRRRPNTAPVPMVFQNRTISPFAVTKESRAGHEDFLPQDLVRAPFMTALRTRPSAKVADDRPLWSAFIYFVDNVENATDRLRSPEQRNFYHTNLKWNDTNPDSARLIRLFLEQTVLEAMVEAYVEGVSFDQIEWRFSYPEAFSTRQAANFEAAARRSIELWTAPADVEVVINSESLTAALFFDDAMRAGLRQDPAVTIDIGGGTSDMSVWHHGKLLWRNSVLLAGRQILIDPMAKIDHLLDDILGTVRDAASKTLYRGVVEQLKTMPDGEEKRFILETLMGNTSFGSEFLNNILTIFNKPSIRQLESVIAIAFAGLLYYAGKTIAWLNFVNADSVTKLPLVICLGGRVSDLFKHVFRDKKTQARLLSIFTAAAGECFSSVRIIFSDRPKHEVAYGLLVDEVGLATEGYKRGGILGESVMVGDTPLAPDANISTLAGAPHWGVRQLTEIPILIDELRRALEIDVEWSQSLNDDIARDVNAVIARTIGKNQGDPAERSVAGSAGQGSRTKLQSSDIEPPFIIALRSLIGQVIEGQCVVGMPD